MEAERADHLENDGQWREDSAFRDAVVAVMARLAAGEQKAVWELHDLAAPSLTRILRAEARRLDLRIGDEDIFDLTLDAAIDVAKLARSWKPDGALPWVWARRRVTALIHGHVGTFARELDETHLDIEEPAVAVPVEDARGTLRSLARRHPSAHNLDERLTTSVSDRDATIWLDVQIEKAAGNRSPAVTVAAVHEMRPDAVRKVVQRVGERLNEVA